MSNKSPLKHKKGDIDAHKVSGAYFGEDKFHEAYPDVVEKPKIKKPKKLVGYVEDNALDNPHQGIPKTKDALEDNYYQNKDKTTYLFTKGKYVEQKPEEEKPVVTDFFNIKVLSMK